jgi:inosine-uridine nucleoside N-ribohydrolase
MLFRLQCGWWCFLPDSKVQVMLTELPICHVGQVLISWECTITHGLEWDWVHNWLARDTPAAKFMAAAMADSIKYQKSTHRDSAWVACDPIAVAAACNGKELVTGEMEVYCDVELHGHLTRGACVFDWEASLRCPCNVRLVTKVDKDVFMRMLDASLS